jgi:hypothetical protein
MLRLELPSDTGSDTGSDKARNCYISRGSTSPIVAFACSFGQTYGLAHHAPDGIAIDLNHHGIKHKLLLTNINTVSVRSMHTAAVACTQHERTYR